MARSSIAAIAGGPARSTGTTVAAVTVGTGNADTPRHTGVVAGAVPPTGKPCAAVAAVATGTVADPNHPVKTVRALIGRTTVTTDTAVTAVT